MTKKILSKTDFCGYIHKWEEQEKLARSIDHTLSSSKVSGDIRDFFSAFALVANGRQDSIDLLSLAMNDNGSWIEYFICELNYGKEWKPGTITDENGCDVVLSTPEELYDFLVKNQNA